VKRSLDDCSETLTLLEKVLANLGGTTKNPFAKVAKNLKLGAKLDKITTLRRQINTYNSTMQLALQMCLISQNLSNETFYETLNAKINLILRETRDIRGHLEVRPVETELPQADSATFLASAPSEHGDTAAGGEEGVDPDFEAKVYDHITEVLENAKSLASVSARDDSASVSGSVVSIGDETYTAIENWIWAEDGPSMSVWAKIEVKLPSNSQLGAYDSRKGYDMDNLHFLCNEIDALCEQESTLQAAISLLMSFFKRWEKHVDRRDMLHEIAVGIKKQRGGGGILAGSQDKPSLTHLVASVNRIEFLGILIQRGADLETGAGGYGTPLHLAAQFGHAQAVLFLLDQGANADVLDTNGMTPFMKACEWGQETTAQILINRTTDIMLQAKGTMRTALHLALAKGLEETSKLIIAAALTVDIQDANGETALLSACDGRWTREPVVDFLLDKGANINAFRKDGESALSLACKGGFSLLVRKLLERGASLQAALEPCNRSPLLYACEQGDVELLKLLFLYGATIDTAKIPIHTSLFNAVVTSKNKEAIKLIIELDRAHFLFARTPDDESSLHIACKMGLSGVTIQWLVDAMSNENSVDKHGRSPLHHAVFGGDVDNIRILLEAGSDIDLVDDTENTALDLAVIEKEDDIARVLLEVIEANPLNASLKFKDTTIVQLASITDDYDTFSLLVEKINHPKRINMWNHDGDSLLHLVTMKNSISHMTLLLNAGADPNVKSSRGHTPLHEATFWDHLSGMELLLKAGAYPNIRSSGGKTPLHEATLSNHLPGMDLLLKAGADPDVRSSGGKTPLHYAASRNHLAGMDLLLKAGADPDVTSSRGDTPLHEATLKNYLPGMELLLNTGADPNVKSSRDMRRHEANVWDHFPGMDLLLNTGEDLKARPSIGDTPLHYAARNSLRAAIELLLHKGGSIHVTNHSGYLPIDVVPEGFHVAELELSTKERPAEKRLARGFGNLARKIGLGLKKGSGTNRGEEIRPAGVFAATEEDIRIRQANKKYLEHDRGSSQSSRIPRRPRSKVRRLQGMPP